ncbi:MAG: tyrosine-type recombinase/integrase, partial [Bacteroidota bacterium]
QRLRWRDVRADFSNPGAGGVLHVRNVPASSYQEGGTTKTGSERAVPLVSMAVEVLAERHEVRATEDADEPVLLRPDRRKGPRSFSMDMASKHWRELRDEAGVTSIPLRKLRASCGTFLASRGVPLKHVQQIYGHADVKLTARVYASAYMDDVRGEMERAFGAIAHGTEK